MKYTIHLMLRRDAREPHSSIAGFKDIGCVKVRKTGVAIQIAKKPALLLLLLTVICSICSAQPLNVSILGQQNVSICSGYQHTIQTSVTGGTPPYIYSWSTGATTSSITVTPVANTTYSVTVTDFANNTGSASMNIWLNPSPAAGFTFSPDSACSGTPINFTNTSTAQPINGCYHGACTKSIKS